MGLWKAGKKWKYAFQHNGKYYGGGGFKTRKEAQASREFRRQSLLAPTSIHEDMALFQAINLYLDESERRFAKKTHEYKKYVLKGFYALRGDGPIGNVTPEDVRRYLSRRPTAHNFNIHRKEIQAFFNFCTHHGYAEHNPVKAISRLPESPTPKQIPSSPEITALLNVALPEEKALILVILYTLGRVGEILRLKWTDIDFERNTIRLGTRKTKDGSLEYSTLPMNESLKAVLEDIKNKRMGEFVFWNRKKKDKFNRRPKLMRSLCKRANIRHMGFHELRHYGATYLVGAGVDLKTTSTLLRHKSIRTTEIYIHALTESQKEGMKKLEGVVT